jgi:hypothetical protein
MASATANDNFRFEMDAYRRSANEYANSLKEPFIALERLRSLYGKCDSVEQKMADQVFAEWALSDDESIRFDALALIDDLNVSVAIPALETLAKRLASELTPSAPFELKKVHRIIARLTA